MPATRSIALARRPDFLMLIYPGFRGHDLPCHQGDAAHVSGRRPMMTSGAPTFASAYYQAAREGWGPGELHIYARGGHGFGMNDRPMPVTGWTARLKDWLDDSGYTTPREDIRPRPPDGAPTSASRPPTTVLRRRPGSRRPRGSRSS